MWCRNHVCVSAFHTMLLLLSCLSLLLNNTALTRMTQDEKMILCKTGKKLGAMLSWTISKYPEIRLEWMRKTSVSLRIGDAKSKIRVEKIQSSYQKRYLHVNKRNGGIQAIGFRPLGPVSGGPNIFSQFYNLITIINCHGECETNFVSWVDPWRFFTLSAA
jgi:hypothetical protein